ncbi:CRISPR-associated protein Csm4 [Methylomarinovum tepidoasis]|uniref:CRISPR system Cms protein Csm4 n=1 Tax=Methylomarinovum tepidoasis TaxID=2840183 RepID=A0AAU9CAG5_9GAMM|nr:CRISPR-associated protein Csm7 [Methylomarinovum sp. IN45]BCX88937.1 CRISPR-associated protein Csm4 [Methylomarinovum sp. IN45]
MTELLEGYTEGRPFAVVSDAFPAGFLPRPALPLHHFGEVDAAERKQVKKNRWIAGADFGRPVADWLALAKSDRELVEHFAAEACRRRTTRSPADGGSDLIATRAQPHNTIHRLTGTTASGEFAPYAMTQYWHCRGMKLAVYLAHDPGRIAVDDLTTLLRDIGQTGFGRDASIGLGKFEVDAVDGSPWPAQEHANAWLTLAPCAPQGLEWNPSGCWYQPFTRFGRHGDAAVHSGRPFKTPVLLADTGAVLTPLHFDSGRCFTGRGLGGDGGLSKAIPQTVHQGYAPVLAIRLERQA